MKTTLAAALCPVPFPCPTGFLEKGRYIVIEADPTSIRTKLARLTPKGSEAQRAFRHRLSLIEQRWLAQFGREAILNLRAALERLINDPDNGDGQSS